MRFCTLQNTTRLPAKFCNGDPTGGVLSVPERTCKIYDRRSKLTGICWKLCVEQVENNSILAYDV